ncbi:FadR/GntR family transcriptional regulator [Actinomadura terrae]|uniref:FadR/GntR family transcriptional regulator n=1 Tax=Actinomadura terrae TaxID=604353 RepID=UPI001FA7F834|nr:GntR family transcriptional regulator [Actinomadura terrae]
MPRGRDGEGQGGAGGLGPLRPARTGEQVAHRLATAIALGEFGPGDRLPSERDLAALLRVSRESVRAALRVLARSNLVEIRRGRGGGAFVVAAKDESGRAAAPEPWAELAELLDYRRLVEGMIARTAAERAGAADHAALARALAAWDAAATTAQARERDAGLHHAVARATHNGRLVQLHERLASELALGVPSGPDDTARAHHHALVAAIARADGDGAARVATEHFTVADATLTPHPH